MYQINFQLQHHHKWMIADLEAMYPFEREVYLALLEKAIAEENDARAQQ